jgi:hypothetical protein
VGFEGKMYERREIGSGEWKWKMEVEREGKY